MVLFLPNFGLSVLNPLMFFYAGFYCNMSVKLQLMKIFFHLFERPFEIQKNGVFLFKISVFVSEILSVLCYAN